MIHGVSIESFLSGAIMMACIAITFFFFRFWKNTRDLLFLFFSVAFAMQAVERIFLLLINSNTEERTYVYFIRLVAFSLIIGAILHKNRSELRPK